MENIMMVWMLRNGLVVNSEILILLTEECYCYWVNCLVSTCSASNIGSFVVLLFINLVHETLLPP